MKITMFYEGKGEEWHCSTFWHISSMSGEAADNWILMSAFVFAVPIHVM